MRSFTRRAAQRSPRAHAPALSASTSTSEASRARARRRPASRNARPRTRRAGSGAAPATRRRRPRTVPPRTPRRRPSSTPAWSPAPAPGADLDANLTSSPSRRPPPNELVYAQAALPALAGQSSRSGLRACRSTKADFPATSSAWRRGAARGEPRGLAHFGGDDGWRGQRTPARAKGRGGGIVADRGRRRRRPVGQASGCAQSTRSVTRRGTESTGNA